MTTPEYSTWLTKQQAADAIGVSTKTIEQFAKDGKMQQAVWRPQNRGAARAVYHPDDVARIAKERQPGASPFVLPAVPTSHDQSGNGNGHHAPTLALSKPEGLQSGTPTGEEVIRLVFAAALQVLTSEKPLTSENSEKLFLTIPEAAVVSGFSQTYLRRKCQSGWSGAIKDGAWKIRRKDLEQL